MQGRRASFHCCPGQQLQARTTDSKRGLYKNVLYCVQAVDAGECVLRMHSDYGDDARTISLPTPSLAKLLRMACAVVYLSGQGRTISGESVILWDTLRPGGRVHRHLTLRHFIMGVQRVVKPEQLNLATFEQEKDLLGVGALVPDEPEGESGDVDGTDDEEGGRPEKRRRLA